MAEDVKTGLYRLDELDDYEVADDDPDVRGWDVIARNGVKIGEVDELIVDPTTMKVRYLDIDLDDDFVQKRPDYRDNNDDYHLLFPVGAAMLDEEADNVLIRQVDAQTLLTYPVYSGEAVTREYENSLRSTLSPTETDYADDTYYDSDLYNEESFYGPRRTRYPDTTSANAQMPRTAIRRRP